MCSQTYSPSTRSGRVMCFKRENQWVNAGRVSQRKKEVQPSDVQWERRKDSLGAPMIVTAQVEVATIYVILPRDDLHYPGHVLVLRELGQTCDRVFEQLSPGALRQRETAACGFMRRVGGEV